LKRERAVWGEGEETVDGGGREMRRGEYDCLLRMQRRVEEREGGGRTGISIGSRRTRLWRGLDAFKKGSGFRVQAQSI
jgi:hypothetical protein